MEYRHDRIALVVYLAGYLADAIDDFTRPGSRPAGNLFERFLGWARRPMRATASADDAQIRRRPEAEPR